MAKEKKKKFTRTKYERTISQITNNRRYLLNEKHIDENLKRLVTASNSRLRSLKNQGWDLPPHVQATLNENNRFWQYKGDNIDTKQNQAMQLANFLNAEYGSVGKLNRAKKRLEETTGEEYSNKEYKDIITKVGKAWEGLSKKKLVHEVDSGEIHNFFQEMHEKSVYEMVNQGVDFIMGQQAMIEMMKENLNNEYASDLTPKL